MDNITWVHVSRFEVPAGRKVVRGRWVFTIKRDANGKISRFKARWVVKGFTQVEGEDYDETYAAVAKPSTLRALFGLIAHYDLEAQQFDILTAFLNAMIGNKHKIYVEQPHGFEDRGGKGMVCLLQKALYGLKQSPMLWYEELRKYLKSLNFIPMMSDVCVFKHTLSDSIIVIYVDDMIIIAHSMAALQAVAQLLKDRFNMRELGDLHYYLGMRIIRNRKDRTIHVVQDAYLNRLSEKYGMQGRVAPATPMAPRYVKSAIQRAPDIYTASAAFKTKYQEGIGEVLWPAMITRPDACYTAGLLSRFIANPTEEHYHALLWLIEYLVGTAARGMCFKGSQNDHELSFVGYCDASWADDPITRRSTGGFYFTLAGGPLLYKSGRQTLVTLSSTEAEYVQLTTAAKEAVPLMRMLEEMGYKGSIKPVTLYEDNQSAIAITQSTTDGRTKHMDARVHYIREKIADGTVVVTWISTHDQIADGFTKPLDKLKHGRFVEQLNLVDCKSAIESAAQPAAEY